MSRSIDPTRARAAAARVVGTLQQAGHSALFAGGCVRDELLNLRPTDYDVATKAKPTQVRSLFRSVHEVGEAFGVMLVTLDGVTVEVATFRTDGEYTDKRRPDSVAFADDKADALRRDFTVNALFLDPLTTSGATTSPLGGTVIDHVNGLADLRSKTLRAVGDPHARLNEDHLRALRAVRFAARLGFTLEAETARAITAHASQLAGVSRERIGEELRRMLTHPDALARARAAGLLQSLTLDGPTLTEPATNRPLPTLAAMPLGTPFSASLAAWMVDRHGLYTPAQPRPETQAIVRRLRSALCLTNDERDELTDLFACLDDLLTHWPERRVAGQKRWAARHGFRWAVRCLAPHHPDLARYILNKVSELESDGIGVTPHPHVCGDDLIGLGFRPGPVFKSLLERLFDEQLEGRLKSKEEGLELARVWGV